MGHKFAELVFTDTVNQLQEADGSRKSYAWMEAGEDSNNVLTDREEAIIGARDSFYMATVSETGGLCAASGWAWRICSRDRSKDSRISRFQRQPPVCQHR